MVAQIAEQDFDTFCLERFDIFVGIGENSCVIGIVVGINIPVGISTDVGRIDHHMGKERFAVGKVILSGIEDIYIVDFHDQMPGEVFYCRRAGHGGSLSVRLGYDGFFCAIAGCKSVCRCCEQHTRYYHSFHSRSSFRMKNRTPLSRCADTLITTYFFSFCVKH